MNDQIENLAVQAQIATDLVEMYQNSAGWQRVRDIIEEMRREAFSEWGELKLDAPTESVIAIRAKDRVLKDLIERIEDATKKGAESREAIAEAERASREQVRFRAEKMTSADEIDALRKPIKNRFLDALLRR